MTTSEELAGTDSQRALDRPAALLAGGYCSPWRRRQPDRWSATRCRGGLRPPRLPARRIGDSQACRV